MPISMQSSPWIKIQKNQRTNFCLLIIIIHIYIYLHFTNHNYSIYIYEQPLYMTLDRVLICAWQFKGLHLFILKCWTWYILSLILKLCLMVSQCPPFPAIIDQSTCLFLALMNPWHRSGKKDKYGSWARDNCRNNH